MNAAVTTSGNAQRPHRTVAQKMGVKPGSRAFLVAAPPSAIDAMRLPPLETAPEISGEFGYLHLFTTTQAGMSEALPALKAHLASSGMLWVSWPKAKQLGTDLTLPAVIRIGYSHGLVESTCLSVDETWSALKFTHPKPGKTYNNSHGALPASLPRPSSGASQDSLSLVHD